MLRRRAAWRGWWSTAGCCSRSRGSWRRVSGGGSWAALKLLLIVLMIILSLVVLIVGLLLLLIVGVVVGVVVLPLLSPL